MPSGCYLFIPFLRAKSQMVRRKTIRAKTGIKKIAKLASRTIIIAIKFRHGDLDNTYKEIIFDQQKISQIKADMTAVIKIKPQRQNVL